MNCYLHPDAPAVAFCRTCGRALCTVCERPAEGTIFCPEHVPVSAYAPPGASAPNPYVAPTVPVRTSPGFAFLLGLIPGVGAIYNGQYIKGLVHAIIFGLLISLTNAADNTAGQPLLGILTFVFYCYMPFEAYHTAKKRQVGLPVDEWSSLLSQRSYSGRAPIGPVLLIAIGVLFLLDTLHLIEFRDIARFWPVILIVLGAYMLYSRLSGPTPHPPPAPQTPPPSRPPDDVLEARNER